LLLADVCRHRNCLRDTPLVLVVDGCMRPLCVVLAIHLLQKRQFRILIAVAALLCVQEGRRCGQDGRLLGGILLGTAVMAWTLYVGA
jgi:hypothetical protein